MRCIPQLVVSGTTYLIFPSEASVTGFDGRLVGSTSHWTRYGHAMDSYRVLRLDGNWYGDGCERLREWMTAALVGVG